mgnify:FL=1
MLIAQLKALGDKHIGDILSGQKSQTVSIEDEDAYENLCKNAEKMNNLQDTIYQKSEEFFRLVLEPVSKNDADYEVLTAENIDISDISGVINDFLSSAGILTKPAIS